MSTENQNVAGWEDLVKAIATALIPLGSNEVESLLHANKATIAPVANDFIICPPGQGWSELQHKCVDNVG